MCVIAVASTKRGTGKTTAALSLAAALDGMRRPVPEADGFL